MTPEWWQRIKPLLQSALERDPAERSAFLAKECGGDEALRKHVESLIASHEQAGEFIEAIATRGDDHPRAGSRRDGAAAINGLDRDPPA